MEISNYFKKCWFLTSIWLLSQLCTGKGYAVDEVFKDGNGAIDLNHQGDHADLKIRMERMEAKSQHQEKEVEILKTQLEEEKQFSKQLSGRISQLEKSAIPASTKNETIKIKRPKRPYRLLPPNVPIM